MPIKDMRPGVKGRAGYRTVTYRDTRGRTRNATVVTRTNGTTLTLKIRGAGPVRNVAGAAKGTTHAKVANTWIDRLSS